MVGRELTNIYPPKNDAEVGEVLLDVKNYSSIHERSFQNCSFQLRRGEILGFGGLVGAAEDRADGSDFRYAPHLNRRPGNQG